MLTYFHDSNDIFIMCDGLDKLGGPTSVTGIAVQVFVVFFSDFVHCDLEPRFDCHLSKRTSLVRDQRLLASKVTGSANVGTLAHMA